MLYCNVLPAYHSLPKVLEANLFQTVEGWNVVHNRQGNHKVNQHAINAGDYKYLTAWTRD